MLISDVTAFELHRRSIAVRTHQANLANGALDAPSAVWDLQVPAALVQAVDGGLGRDRGPVLDHEAVVQSLRGRAHHRCEERVEVGHERRVGVGLVLLLGAAPVDEDVVSLGELGMVVEEGGGEEDKEGRDTDNRSGGQWWEGSWHCSSLGVLSSPCQHGSLSLHVSISFELSIYANLFPCTQYFNKIPIIDI